MSIAVAILAAFGYIDKTFLKQSLFIGELSLDGKIKSVNGVLPRVYTAYENGFKYCIVPKDNIPEAEIVSKINIIALFTWRSKRYCDYISNSSICRCNLFYE